MLLSVSLEKTQADRKNKYKQKSKINTPQTVGILLNNMKRLTFEMETDACTVIGFSNVKLYYR